MQKRPGGNAWPLYIWDFMHLPHYQIESSGDSYTFGFVSNGTKGRIAKLVNFMEIGDNLYNLGFGDKGSDDAVDDLAVTNNGDAELVLATVVMIVHAFLAAHPEAVVYAEGSTPVRTRLYQIGITTYQLWLDDSIAIFGSKDGEWEAFTPGRNYHAFAAAKRT